MKLKLILNAAVAALAVLWIHAGFVQAEPDKPSPEETRQQESRQQEFQQQGGPRDYWIGVQCSPVEDPALRVQLGLERHEGMLVDDVLPDGPAAKAGLKRFDVLISADGVRLRNVHSLQQAINDAPGDDVKLEFYRGGKRQTVAVHRVERPRLPGEFQPVMPQRDRDAVRQWLDSLRNGEPGVPPRALHFFGPGFVMPPAEATLPDDMSVSIMRQGKQPAKIVVKQGEQTWETTEDKLSELPSEVRREVEKLLPPNMPPFNPMQPMPGPALPSRRMPEQLDRPLQDINRQLEQMRKRLDQLEQQPGSDRAPSERNR
jgi:hypothetical protein